MLKLSKTWDFAGDRDEGEQNLRNAAVVWCNSLILSWSIFVWPSLGCSLLKPWISIRSLGLNGPSFRSVFHCISKYYMRLGGKRGKLLEIRLGRSGGRGRIGWSSVEKINPSQINLRFSWTFLLAYRRPREILRSFPQNPHKVIQISPTPSLSNQRWVCRKELSPNVSMTKIDPLASPSPPKTFPVVVKEMLGGMGSPYPHKEVRGSINQQMLFGVSSWGLQSSVFIGGYRARSRFEMKSYGKNQCDTGQSWVTLHASGLIVNSILAPGSFTMRNSGIRRWSTCKNEVVVKLKRGKSAFAHKNVGWLCFGCFAHQV